MIFYFWPDKFGILSLSLSCCVWPCGRLISINVETNLKCENRKPKTENRIRMGAQQIKIKIKVCRGVSRTGNCELGTFLTHIIWWFYDFTTHIVALYDISSGRLTTFLVGTVGIALGYLRAEFGEQTGSVSGRFPRQPPSPPPSIPLQLFFFASKRLCDLLPRNGVSWKPFAASAYKTAPLYLFFPSHSLSLPLCAL